MKTTLISLALLFGVSYSSTGQCHLPNGDFEIWSDHTDTLGEALGFELLHPVSLPDGWTPLFRLVEIVLSTFIIDFFDKDTLDVDLFRGIEQVQPGANGTASALKLRGDSLFVLSDASHRFTCTSRPNKITGYFKYDGAVNDSLLIIAFLSNADSLDEVDAIAVAQFISSGGPAEFTKFEADFEYASDALPDTARLFIISVKDQNAPNDTSAFYLDEIKLEGETVAAINYVQRDAFMIFPNPVDEVFTLNSELRNVRSIEIIDGLGKVVYNKQKDLEDTFNIGHLVAGLYYARVKIGKEIFFQKLVKN